MPAGSAAQVRRRVIIVQRFDPFFGPFFPWYAYPYPYPGYYMAANYGEVKIDPNHRLADVYIDGGYAATITKSKKFALRPGKHNIVLKNSDGVTIYHKRVAVLVGATTKLRVLLTARTAGLCWGERAEGKGPWCGSPNVITDQNQAVGAVPFDLLPAWRPSTKIESWLPLAVRW